MFKHRVGLSVPVCAHVGVFGCGFVCTLGCVGFIVDFCNVMLWFKND